VATCSSIFPNETQYFSGNLLFDNVLTGDWAIINPNPVTGNLAAGSPLVHIRAIPEGSLAGEPLPTPLRRTFYELYTPEATPAIDRRQPLPANFAARYIEGGTSGFFTSFVIWRQPVKPAPPCGQSIDNFSDTAEVIRFDERENVFIRFTPFFRFERYLPVTSRKLSLNAGVFPALTSGDIGGWMYINATEPTTTPQTWVVTVMQSEGRYSVAFDAVALGNGCSPRPAVPATIGPAQ
ncbi:MAG TPA: hypothetical protein VMU84_19995, partial [Thermoanaerobaculia bacterium]|nr:hypothetical protein [Thermoanaerobaculia bacterium]